MTNGDDRWQFSCGTQLSQAKEAVVCSVIAICKECIAISLVILTDFSFRCVDAVSECVR